ncbi:MAG TPA: cadmium-translocating P-type ATPase [Acholeplasmataceae bacterium]|nr:cadmium-translocating P-type ATPase [Acholeplasmataceae bacterium]
MKLNKHQKMIVNSILVLVSFILYKILGYHIATIILMLITTALSGYNVFKKAIVSLRYMIIGIDILVTIAVIGAIIIGEYWEAAAVTYLFMLGEYLEARTIEKTRSSIKSLLDLAPKFARVIYNNEEIEINPEDVIVGDLIVVKPGEKIPVDGLIKDGSAYVNESTITGESLPVNKEMNDEVFSGTIVESGYLIIEAVSVGNDTTFSRILTMVEEAQDKKARTQKFVERFSKYYTPGIIILAILVYIIKKDIYLSLTLLVISCPGALVISTPVSIVAGIGNGAKQGVLFKGGEVIESLAKAKVIAFDKTGTLTINKPTVTKINSIDISKKELLKIAAIGESYSEHPLAKAIINKANELNLNIKNSATDFEIITGKGIKFVFDDKKYYLGNRLLLDENNVDYQMLEKEIQNEENNGQTVVLVGTEKKILGSISIADVIREDAKMLVQNLYKSGVKKLIILSGDNNRTVKAIAKSLGIKDYYGSLLPEEKVAKIKELKDTYGEVIMVGDGVNDAPALVTADLGIAIGGAGKDVAMETADIVILGDNISKTDYAIKLSKATKRNLKQNLIFALIVVTTLLLGVLVNSVNLSIGMLVHELSVLLVIFNAIRLLSFGKRGKIKR